MLGSLCIESLVYSGGTTSHLRLAAYPSRHSYMKYVLTNPLINNGWTVVMYLLLSSEYERIIIVRGVVNQYEDCTVQYCRTVCATVPEYRTTGVYKYCTLIFPPFPAGMELECRLTVFSRLPPPRVLALLCCAPVMWCCGMWCSSTPLLYTVVYSS